MTVAPPKLVADTTWSWWTIHPIQQLALAVLKRVGCHQHHPVVLFVVDDDGMGGHDEIRLVRVDVDEPFRLCVDDDEPSPSSSIVGRRSAARQSEQPPPDSRTEATVRLHRFL